MDLHANHLTAECSETQSSVITVVGVGGGGGNAVNCIYRQGIRHVSFVICNNDAQALEKSPVPIKIHLGKKDLDDCDKPQTGREEAEKSIDEIRAILETGTKIVLVSAGMGGSTGTGAAPVIVRVAKELGILTVAIVTMPFRFEGPLRTRQAIEGISKLIAHADLLLVIDNEKLREMYGDLEIEESFSKADNVLRMAVSGITETGPAMALDKSRVRKAIETTLDLVLLKNSDIVVPASVVKNGESAFLDYYGFTRKNGKIEKK